MKTPSLARARRSGGAMALGLVVVLLAAPSASSKSPRQVDQATLVPPLNMQFAPWSCFEAGSGITCQGGYESDYNEPIGLFCGGQEVWIAGTVREFMTRWHTEDGRATKTVVHLDFPGDVFSLSPDGDGSTLTVRGHFNRHYVYPVPGDRSSRVLKEVGAIYLANESGNGIVVHDTGAVTFEPGAEFEEIAEMHGVHDIYDDQTAFDQLICDRLT
jgi:hypothetical protein